MSTATHISLPQSLVESARPRVREGKFGTIRDYIKSLIREDLVRQDEQKLEQMLLDSIASGSQEITPTEWKSLKQEILEAAQGARS